ncbi:MAG: NFACT family protein [Vampirovibrionales bacterium]|nr:NFACT family protein [Vampirovibrionales bacterium]
MTGSFGMFQAPPTWQPDAVALAYLAQSLHQQLVGARIQKIQHLTHREWVLTLFAPHRKEEELLGDDEIRSNRLYLSVDKQHPALCLLSAADIDALVKPTFTKPTNDCMLLRKHLLHGRIRSVTAMPGERAIVMTIENTNELGQVVPWQWVLELMGRYSTWWLVEGDTQTIVGSAYRVTESMSAHRPLAVGECYVPPPIPKGRVWLGALPEKTVANAIKGSDTSSKSLLALGYGASPVMLQAIVASCSPTEGPAMVACRLQAVLQSDPCWKSASVNGTLSLFWDESHSLPEASWTQALSTFQRDVIQQQRLKQVQTQCRQAVEREQERLKQRILTQQPTETPESITEWELRGHALMTEASQQPVNACPLCEEVVVMHPTTGEPWKVPVNPEKNWRDNANVAYQHVKNAADQRRQWETASQVLAEREQQLAQWEWEVAQLETLPEAWALLASLGAVGIVKSAQPFVAQGRGKVAKLQTKSGKHKGSSNPKSSLDVSSLAGLSRWKNPDGVVFWMGRQGEANAALLSKIARHNDVWCHAWNQPGAHVVIQCPLAECSEETLLDGLMLAAAHSQQGGGAFNTSASQSATAIKVDVVYTECRHVRAVPGSYPGHVTYKLEKTALIAVDSHRLQERLTFFHRSRD